MMRYTKYNHILIIFALEKNLIKYGHQEQRKIKQMG